MKKLFFILSLSLSGISFAQGVGINTTTPEIGTALHVAGGTVKAEEIPLVVNAAYIVVTDTDGILKKVPLSSILVNSGTCPNFLKNDSSGYALKFSSSSSVPNPNNAIVVNGINFISGGTYTQGNLYYFHYSNTTGQPLNINQPFTITWGNLTCSYN